MNKKYLIVGGVIVIFLIILLVSIFFQKSPSQQTSVSEQTSNLKNQTAAVTSIKNHTSSSPSLTLAPPASTASQAVQQFYTYYFSSPSNPLANGAYKTNPYLSPDFKNVIGALYNNGNTPVFCPENKRTNIVVGQETSVNYTNAILTQEVISAAPPESKDLYRVLVQQINGKWLIYDINCL